MEAREREEGEPGRGEGQRRKRGERRRKTLRVLHLDQDMTDNIPADHPSAPLFDDKAHPPSTIHYWFSLPEARASIMLPLRDAAPPPRRTQARPSLVGIPGRASLPPSHSSPTCRAADHLLQCPTPTGGPPFRGLGPDAPTGGHSLYHCRWMNTDILVPGLDF